MIEKNLVYIKMTCGVPLSDTHLPNHVVLDSVPGGGARFGTGGRRGAAGGWAELRDRVGIDHGGGAGARPWLESTKAEVWMRGRGGDKIEQGGDRRASGAPTCSRRGAWAARSAPVWSARQRAGEVALFR